MSCCWVYIQTERWTDEDGTPHSLFTVGFYDPNGRFQPDSDHSRREDAARRCNFLNGGREALYEAD